MSDYYDEPELTGYEPHEPRGARSPRRRRAMKALVLLGIVALVLPGILTTYSLAKSTAQAACAATIAQLSRTVTASGSRVQFEFFGPGGAGWQCYTVGAYGGDRMPVAPLGLIPSYPAPAQVPADGG